MHQYPRQNPSLLAGGKTGCQQSVIDFSRYGKPAELGCWNKQPRIVRKSVGGRIHVAFGSRDDAIPILVDPSNLQRIGIKETLVEISHVGLKRSQPFIHVQENLVGQSTGNEALTKFSLPIILRIEFIRVTWTRCLDYPLGVWIVTITEWGVSYATRARARNDGLKSTNLACFCRPWDAARKWQFIKWVDPVRRVIELPVGMAVGLLQRIPGTHAQLNGDDVGLSARKMIRCVRESR